MPDWEGVLNVQVCYAQPGLQILRSLCVAAGACAQDAVLQSGVLEEAGGLAMADCRLGIHGKLKPPDTRLREGDRVEIYRPLTADPKDARRRRAAKKSG
jgi:putative ubiquitin-RnfH superfamily antitoxin RatB of RatAB toxin-antitoxin module